MTGWIEANMKYTTYLATDHWRELREAKLLEANYRCQKCKRKSRLQVHHVDYARLGRERLSDLMVLCESCHEKEHDLFPAYVDDWKQPVRKSARPKPTRECEEMHPLFKYVQPIKDGRIAR